MTDNTDGIALRLKIINLNIFWLIECSVTRLINNSKNCLYLYSRSNLLEVLAFHTVFFQIYFMFFFVVGKVKELRFRIFEFFS